MMLECTGEGSAYLYHLCRKYSPCHNMVMNQSVGDVCLHTRWVPYFETAGFEYSCCGPMLVCSAGIDRQITSQPYIFIIPGQIRSSWNSCYQKHELVQLAPRRAHAIVWV